jgi:hypothetical protein
MGAQSRGSSETRRSRGRSSRATSQGLRACLGATCSMPAPSTRTPTSSRRCLHACSHSQSHAHAHADAHVMLCLGLQTLIMSMMCVLPQQCLSPSHLYSACRHPICIGANNPNASAFTWYISFANALDARIRHLETHEYTCISIKHVMLGPSTRHQQSGRRVIMLDEQTHARLHVFLLLANLKCVGTVTENLKEALCSHTRVHANIKRTHMNASTSTYTYTYKRVFVQVFAESGVDLSKPVAVTCGSGVSACVVSHTQTHTHTHTSLTRNLCVCFTLQCVECRVRACMVSHTPQG